VSVILQNWHKKTQMKKRSRNIITTSKWVKCPACFDQVYRAMREHLKTTASNASSGGSSAPLCPFPPFSRVNNGPPLTNAPLFQTPKIRIISPAGTWINKNLSTCVSCELGRYAEAAAYGKCADCGPGFHTNGRSSAAKSCDGWLPLLPQYYFFDEELEFMI